jgi:hypothetical protein
MHALQVLVFLHLGHHALKEGKAMRGVCSSSSADSPLPPSHLVFALGLLLFGRAARILLLGLAAGLLLLLQGLQAGSLSFFGRPASGIGGLLLGAQTAGLLLLGRAPTSLLFLLLAAAFGLLASALLGLRLKAGILFALARLLSQLALLLTKVE